MNALDIDLPGCLTADGVGPEPESAHGSRPSALCLRLSGRGCCRPSLIALPRNPSLPMNAPSYPPVLDPSRVGTYPALAKSGGGLVWDAVLEYRVWCHPERGAPDLCEGSDYFHAFTSHAEAAAFAADTAGAEEPLALVLQEEHINEPEPGVYVHVRERRITEWPVQFLSRPRRTAGTIPAFLAPDAPANRLDILRGIAAATDAGEREAS